MLGNVWKGTVSLFRRKLVNCAIVIGAFGTLAIMELIVETINSDNTLYQRDVNVRYFCLFFAIVLYRRIERILIPSSVVNFEELSSSPSSRFLPTRESNNLQKKLKQSVLKRKAKILINNIIPSNKMAILLYLIFFVVAGII